MEKELLEEREVYKLITDHLGELSGKEIANLANDICSGHLEYQGDSLWEHTTEDREGDE